MSKINDVKTVVVLRDPIHGFPLVSQAGTDDTFAAYDAQLARRAKQAQETWDGLKLSHSGLALLELEHNR